MNAANTFETFIASDANAVIAKFCREVVQDPREAFNPLWLIGESGTGKTHLLDAICNEAKKKDDLCFFYTTAEELEELFLQKSSAKDNPILFMAKKADLLLVDNVEALVGKEKMQTTFGKFFVSRAAKGKQTVFASDFRLKSFRALYNKLRKAKNHLAVHLSAEVRSDE